MYHYSLSVLNEGNWSLELRTDPVQEVKPADAVLYLLDAYADSVAHTVSCAHCNARLVLREAKCILMQHVVNDPSGLINNAWGAVGFSCPDNQTCVYGVSTCVRVHWKNRMDRLRAEGKSGVMFRVCHTCGTSEASMTTDTPKFRVCGRCKNVHYCSTECQRKDWAQHQHLCRPGPYHGNDKTHQ